MIEILLIILLATVACAGVLLAVFQLPGTWLILAAAVAYDGYHGWSRLGWKALAALAVVALVAEVLESLASVAAARRAGASRRAAIGSLIGGLAGMILLSVPVPIIGTIVGGMIGCFAGAFIAEMSVRDDLSAGIRVGVFATIGRALGLAAKSTAALLIAGTVTALALHAMP